MHAAFSGPAGAAFALATVVYEVKHSIDETSAALDEMASKAAEHDFLPGIEAKLDVLRNAIGAAASYALKLGDIKAGESGVSEELKKQLALDQAIERARASLISAEKGLEIAKIQKKESLGQLNPEQAAQARADVEKKAIQQEQANHEASQNQELQRKQAALAEAQKRQKDLETAQAAAAQAAADFKAHQVKVAQDFGNPEQFNKSLEEAQKRREEANKKLEDLTRKYRSHGEFIETPATQAVFSEAEEDARMAKGKVDLLNRGRRQYQDSISPKSIKYSTDLDKANESNSAAANENAGTIRALTDQIGELVRVISATRPIEREATGLKTQTVETSTDATRAGMFKQSFDSDLQQLENIEKKATQYTSRHTNTADQQREIASLNALLKQTEAHAAAMVKSFAGLGGTISNINARLEQAELKAEQAMKAANQY